MGIFRIIEIWHVALALIAAVITLIGTLKNPKVPLVILGIMLFLGSLGVSEIALRQGELRTFLFPLQAARAPLYTALGGILVLATVVMLGRIRLHSISIVAATMFMLGVYMGFIHIAHDANDGLLTLVVAMVTLGPMAVVLPSLIDSWRDARLMLKMVAWVGLVWLALTAVQFVINPRALLAMGQVRFSGLMGNPQHSAAYAATMMTIAAYLALTERKKRERLLWIAMSATMAAIIAWTGSRTGTLMGMIGLASLFYRRAGTGLLFLAGAFFFLVIIVSGLEAAGITIGYERLFSTADTRSEAWTVIIEQIRENAIIGVGPANQMFSENSFLLAWSSFGIGAFALCLLLFIASVIQGLRLLGARPMIAPEHRTLADLLCGILAMLWAGALFEGYFAGRVNAQLIFLMMAAACSVRIIDLAKHDLAVAQGDIDPEHHEPGETAEGYEWYDDPDLREPARAN